MSTKSKNKDEQFGSLNFQLVYDWATKNLGSNNLYVYVYIARMCVGYKQTTTEPISYKNIMDKTGISKPTLMKTLRYLKDNNFIETVISNYCNEPYKVANRYKLVFRKDLNFPYLNITKESKNELKQTEEKSISLSLLDDDEKNKIKE